MATQGDKDNNKAKFIEVVQVALMPEEVEDIVSHFMEEKEILHQVASLSMQGYDFTTTFDPKRMSYGVCIIGRTTDCPNAGLWMYGNGESLIAAYTVVLFKHLEIFGGGKWIARQSDKGVGIS